MTNTPESWHGQTEVKRERERERDLDSWSVWPPKCTSVKCTLRMVETKEKVLVGHKAKLLGIEQDKRKLICTLTALAELWVYWSHINT